MVVVVMDRCHSSTLVSSGRGEVVVPGMIRLEPPVVLGELSASSRVGLGYTCGLYAGSGVSDWTCGAGVYAGAVHPLLVSVLVCLVTSEGRV